MPTPIKHKTKYTGIRYVEHHTRKNGRIADRYFYIRYPSGKTTKEEGLGWATDGWTAEKAYSLRSQIRQAQKIGHGPTSLAEIRALAQEDERLAAKEAEAAKKSAITLAEFLETHYIPHIKKSKRSWKLDVGRIAYHINPALGHLPFLAVKKSDVQNFAEQLLESGLRPGSVRVYLMTLSGAYSFASKASGDEPPFFSGRNPVHSIGLPLKDGSRERFLTPPEAELLISAATKLPSRTVHDAIILALNTGLRVGEICRLTWFEVDFTSNFITVREEAMRKPGGKVPMNKDVRTALLARKAELNPSLTDLVFQSQQGESLRILITRTFATLVKQIGLNDGLAPDDRARRVVFHTLRHTFASWLAINGVDIYRIKSLMRHRKLEMTMRYAHLIPEATQEAVKGLTQARSAL